MDSLFWRDSYGRRTLFCQSPSVIPAHPPGAYDTSRASHLCVSLVAHSASDFAGSARYYLETGSPELLECIEPKIRFVVPGKKTWRSLTKDDLVRFLKDRY